MLVEQGLGDPRRLGDVVHRRGPVAAVGEELQRHGEQLLPPLLGGEPPGSGLRSRPTSGSGYRLVTRLVGRPGTRGQDPGQPRREVGQVEVGRRHRVVVRQQLRVRRASHAASGAGSAAPNQRKPNAASSAATG